MSSAIEGALAKGQRLGALPLVRAGVLFVDGVQEKRKTAAGEVKENAAEVTRPIHNI